MQHVGANNVFSHDTISMPKTNRNSDQLVGQLLGSGCFNNQRGGGHVHRTRPRDFSVQSNHFRVYIALSHSYKSDHYGEHVREKSVRSS